MSHDRPIRVLVVDDEDSIRESLTRFLEDYSYDIMSVGSAEEALTLLDKETFQVGIIDLRLPKMSGEALILRIYKRWPNMR